jgi:methylmalonyl-CoA mutase
MNSGASENKPDFSFAYPTYQEWLEVARQELEGVDPTEKLSIRKGDIEILPFYTVSQKEVGNAPLLKPSSNPYLGARSWMNTPKIIVTDDAKANEIALSDLNSGAEGILFDCQSENINPAILLNKISLADCSISFLLSGFSKKWLEDFLTLAESNCDKSKIKGCIFWKTFPENYAEIVQSFEHWTQFYALGIQVQPQEDTTDEIAHSLNRAVQWINVLSEKKINTHILLNQISFSISVGTDFFLDIARIKSLRNLWHQIKGAYDISTAKSLHIHASSTVWIKDAYQPHGNLIKSTTAAMAAIAGGCDSLTVEQEDNTNETMSRVARNVSSILREESHFSKVADPTAGSYYIDSLTDQLSEKAWSKFQSLVKG